MKDLEKNVSMLCTVCGNDQFSTVDEGIEDLLNAPNETELKCSDCGHVTTKEQLLEDNNDVIEANLEDMTNEAMKQAQKELDKMVKDFNKKFKF